MIRILMNGCNGKMGQVITRLCSDDERFEIIAGISRQPELIHNSYPCYESIEEAMHNQMETPNIVIDFSVPCMLPQVIDYCQRSHVALIVGTTGLSVADNELLKKASDQIPVFVSANMSLGIHVITNLAVTTAPMLHDAFDIEIIERHHHDKKDAPSGTAKMIANEINESLNHTMHFITDRTQNTEKRTNNEIGISSVRAGTIPGEHTILFAGHDEIIEIKHTALSRDIFGKGALMAAEYLSGKNNGFYTMQTMLKELI